MFQDPSAMKDYASPFHPVNIDAVDQYVDIAKLFRLI